MSTGFTLTASGEKELLGVYLHSQLLSTLLTGMFLTHDLQYIPYKLVYFFLHLTGIYTPLYLGTMYIYGETVVSINMVFMNNSQKSKVTGRSSKSGMVIAATTILYVSNVIAEVLAWLKILLLIGTSGDSRSESLQAELSALVGINGVLVQLSGLLPFVVTDGLLVRNLPREFVFLLHFIDMAVLQIME